MKILVVDDHVLIRDALRGVLKELKDDADVLEASDCRQAMALIAENADDLGLILLDLGLPDRDGFSALAEVRERYPAISVIVLSGQHDRASVEKAFDLGALGFIPKSAERAVMLGALNLVFAGGVYVPPEVLAPAAPVTGAARQAETTGQRSQPDDLRLTARQGEVLALMMKGKGNKAICRELGLAEPTVKNNVSAILKALNVNNRTEAVIAAGALRLETPHRAGG
jgi:DNA-binding NarL/FixJ family response regulator